MEHYIEYNCRAPHMEEEDLMEEEEEDLMEEDHIIPSPVHPHPLCVIRAWNHLITQIPTTMMISLAPT